MSDVWELVTANATDKTDFWSALNSQQCGGNTPGKIIDELRFSIQPLIRLSGSISTSSLTGTIGQSALTGSVANKSLSGAVQPNSLSGSIAIKEL